MRCFLVCLPAIWTLALNGGCTAATVEEITVATAPTGESPVAQPGDWPWWRGPAGDGHAVETDVPTIWTDVENVRWKAPVPGRGHSTPCVVGQLVFVTTADEQAQQQLLVCYDRESGDQLWQKIVHDGGLMRGHPKNSNASASPACDGQNVYAAFINSNALWVTAYDLKGELVWQKEAGPFESQHGYGPSPVLYKSTIILAGDNAGASFIAALDRASGDVVWRKAREKTGDFANYATPIVGQVAGRPQLLIAGNHRVCSFDPDTGERLWWCDGPSRVAACTMAFDDERVYATGGWPEKEILALPGDKTGQLDGSQVVWRSKKGVAYVPSPLLADGLLYLVSDQGVAICYDAATGEQLWQKRLNGEFSASPVLAGDKIYVTNESGATFVLRAGREFEQIAVNDLGSGGFASPVICGGSIFLRTGDSLLRIEALN